MLSTPADEREEGAYVSERRCSHGMAQQRPECMWRLLCAAGQRGSDRIADHRNCADGVREWPEVPAYFAPKPRGGMSLLREVKTPKTQ
jgi:hypothetical protein